MARAYAQITTSIWRDDDFRSLTVEQQALYFTLDSQGEISAAGTLPLTERRWSKLAADWTVERIRRVLAELVEAGHCAIDEDTEEVLLVKFVKWDNGYRNGKRLPVIREAALSIASPILRKTLAAEFAQLGLCDMASTLVPNRPPDTASDSPSDAVPPSDRVVVKQGEYVPQPSTHNPQPSGRPAADALPDVATVTAAIRAYVANCPEPPAAALQAKVERSARTLLGEGHPPDRIIAAAASAGRAGWTDLGVQMQRDATRASPQHGTSTTDTRVGHALSLADQLDRKAIR